MRDIVHRPSRLWSLDGDGFLAAQRPLCAIEADLTQFGQRPAVLVIQARNQPRLVPRPPGPALQRPGQPGRDEIRRVAPDDLLWDDLDALQH
jgi:hypothetical protein